LANESAPARSGTEIGREFFFSEMQSPSKEKAFQQGKDGPSRTKNLQSAPHRAASARSVKVNETDMNHPVGNVSGGGWMEWREECKAHQGGKEMESPLARRRRQSQPKILQSAPHRAASARRVKTRSTQLSRTIWCVPCQAAAGWRDRDRAHQGSEEIEDSQSAPHREASASSVKKGQRDGQEQSSGDGVRRRLDGEIEIEPIKAAKKWKTRRVNRIGRPLRGE
jgi:hypothetical protein